MMSRRSSIVEINQILSLDKNRKLSVSGNNNNNIVAEDLIEAFVGMTLDNNQESCLILYIPSMKIQMQFSKDMEFHSMTAVELFKRNTSSNYSEIKISFEWIDELFGLYDQKVHLEFEMQAVASKLQDKFPSHILQRLHK
jgi:hypothetical protein